MSDSYILDITWEDRPLLPRLVGPFPSREIADQWALLNIPNGSWEVCPLTYPYAKAGQ